MGPIYIEDGGYIDLDGRLHLDFAARIFKSTIIGPLHLSRDAQIGPDVTAGKYVSFGHSSHFASGAIGSYCAVGSRCCLNARNHPTDWLSTHGFQYHSGAFDFFEEYRKIERLPPPARTGVSIGNDVWIGNQVNIIGGVSVGDGAIIGAGSIVTKDVPPYAIVVGAPARVHRFRFSETIIARLLRVQWWELELSELSGLPFNNIEKCLDLLESHAVRRRFFPDVLSPAPMTAPSVCVPARARRNRV